MLTAREDLHRRGADGRQRQPERQQEGAEGRRIDHRKQFVEEAAESVRTKRHKRTDSRGTRLEATVLL